MDDRNRAFDRGVASALRKAPIVVVARLADRGARVVASCEGADPSRVVASGDLVALATLAIRHGGPDGAAGTAPRFGPSKVGPSSHGPAMRHTGATVTGALVRPGQRCRNDAHGGNSARAAISREDCEIDRRAFVRAKVDALPQGNAKERKRARSLARMLARR